MSSRHSPEWLNKLFAQVSRLLEDRLTIEPGTAKRVEHPDHGICWEHTFPIVFKDQMSMPYELGVELEQLIEVAAHHAGEELVSTRVPGGRKSRRDFCDWGYYPPRIMVYFK